MTGGSQGVLDDININLKTPFVETHPSVCSWELTRLLMLLTEDRGDNTRAIAEGN